MTKVGEEQYATSILYTYNNQIDLVRGRIPISELKKIKDDLNNSLSNSSLFDSVKFTKDLETLYQKLESSDNDEMLETGIVDAAIKWVEKTANKPGDIKLADFNDSSSILTTWKRKVAPRSPNQH